MNHHSNAVVLVIEGLGPGLVGAYGSATAATPALDRLAAAGLVLDQCFVDSLLLDQQLESLWTGSHAAQRSMRRLNEVSSLWHLLANRAIPARLITDCPHVADVAQRLGCEQIVLVEVAERTALAEEPDQCALVEIFATAIEELSLSSTRGLVWIHSRGLKHPWDAPQSLRMQMTDPDDPQPPSVLCVPNILVQRDTDPDVVVGWGQVAAAQVAVIDQSIESLVHAIRMRDDHGAWNWLVTSLGGYPLGEHGQIGWLKHQLYGEEVSIPAIVQSVDVNCRGARRGELCQLPDLFVILLECMGVEPEKPVWGRSLLRATAPTAPHSWPVEHTIAWIEHADSAWVRTPAWSLIIQPQIEPMLFVKPDDRWEVVDVASRRDDLVEKLVQLHDEIKRVTLAGDRCNLPRLEGVLCELCR